MRGFAIRNNVPHLIHSLFYAHLIFPLNGFLRSFHSLKASIFPFISANATTHFYLNIELTISLQNQALTSECPVLDGSWQPLGGQ